MNLKLFNLLISLFLVISFSLTARPSSYPYISGDTFRAFCDYIYDETGNNIIPENVKYGDTIFLKTDYLRDFFCKVHSKIANPYILVTHNSDYAIPGKYGFMLDDPKIIMWFGQNVEGFTHPKLHPIPIGVANRYWSHGNVNDINDIFQIAQNSSRNIFLYMNFAPNTYPKERPYVHNLFKDRPYCTTSSIKDFRSYLYDLAHTKFVLSPRGNGLDCHRTWESIYMGAIPIVVTSTIDSLYKFLPVVIINNWNEVNEEFLKNKWEEISHNEYQLDRRFADYWFNLISSYKNPQR